MVLIGGALMVAINGMPSHAMTQHLNSLILMKRNKGVVTAISDSLGLRISLIETSSSFQTFNGYSRLPQ